MGVDALVASLLEIVDRLERVFESTREVYRGI